MGIAEDEVKLSNLQSSRDWEEIILRKTPLEKTETSRHDLRLIPTAPSLEPASIIIDRFTHNSISKSSLESKIFNLGEANETVQFLGKVGVSLHEMCYSAAKAKYTGGNDENISLAIRTSSGYRKLTRMSQMTLDDKPHTSQADLPGLEIKAKNIVDGLNATYGQAKRLANEVSLNIPVSHGAKHAGLLTLRSDWIVIDGGISSGIADIKTGSFYSEERLLFNLVMLALEWATVQSRYKYERFWNGKRICLTSPTPISQMDYDDKATFSLIWPDRVVTNHNFGLTQQEFILCQRTCLEWLLKDLRKPLTLAI